MAEHLKVAQTALQESHATASDAQQSLLRVPYKSLRDPTATLRVNKWDAFILDSEIMGLLKAPMKSMFSLFEPGMMERVKPEIDALLGAMLFIFTTGMRRPTPGMKLENVQYAPQGLTRGRIVALFVLSVAGPYAWKRLFRYLSSPRWSATASNDITDNSEERRSRFIWLMKKIETVVITCQFANLLLFLRKGTYRSLPERCLGMKMESITPSTSPRSINFEYMTRQLLWDGLMEFGNFMLPFLTWSRLKTTTAFQYSIDGANRTSYCSLCGIEPPQTPYITSCKHVYCYYCLQTAVAAEEDFACVVCGVKFDSSQRLRV